MVSHFGHFVQSPSGMSRFLDLPAPSLGFLGNVASLSVGVGVNAGSTVSRPSDFLVKEVVAMSY
jgi:hypothetical protein